MNTLTKYIDYLKNVGGSISIKKFDEDWEPIGEAIRFDLHNNNVTREEEGVMFLIGHNSIL